MPKIHSHYENLKVARDAPSEVIRAAYRSLSQKYHPDRNPDNDDAARIMKVLNAAYETLSDPTRRREHDQWIAAAESSGSTTQQPPQNPASRPSQAPTIDVTKVRQHSKPNQTTAYKTGGIGGGFGTHILKNWFGYGLGALIFLVWENDKPSSPPPAPKPYQATPSPMRPEYVRPNTAPNGQPWPTSAGYVLGYQLLHTDGLSTITVDNSQNDSDVFVKLLSIDGTQAYPVRHFYIPAFGSFTLNKVTAGSYDIRYRDLSNGGLSRSEAFNLDETPTYNGTQYSNITMTLFKVKNGNMKTYRLSETEF